MSKKTAPSNSYYRGTRNRSSCLHLRPDRPSLLLAASLSESGCRYSDVLLIRVGEREVYSRKTQASRRTIVHQSCSLYSNKQIMKYTLKVAKTAFNLGKNKEKYGKSKRKNV